MITDNLGKQTVNRIVINAKCNLYKVIFNLANESWVHMIQDTDALKGLQRV